MDILTLPPIPQEFYDLLDALKLEMAVTLEGGLIVRCHVRIQVGTTGLYETYCYEPLNSEGKCPIHGQQAFMKPDWMGVEQWKNWLDRTGTIGVKVPGQGQVQGE